jgi:hypothetical protein
MGVALLASALTGPPAHAQSGGDRQRAREEALSRVFGQLPGLVTSLLEKGNAEFFRLLENLELFRVESEIDRYVGPPRTLHDSTTYKLSLLPFHIRYPIYRQLVDQMTRLDNVRSRPIHMVTPDSVSLIDLHIQPILTLEEFQGQGAGPEVQRSLLQHFTAREIADLSVFMLAQQPFFPEDDEGWARVKRRIARASVPIALGALTTGAAFDSGALSHSGTLYKWSDQRRLRYYGGFRGLGFRGHPLLRTGVAVRTPGVEAAAGISDQVRPAATEPDSAIELAVRTGWLNGLDPPAGWDAFFETTLRRAIHEPSGFTGDRTTARAGFFFKREEPRWLPKLNLRGSAEAESDLADRLHIVAALGVERPRAGITTILHGSLVPSSPTGGGIHDARLNLFVAGTMEPISAAFEEEMASQARQAQAEWTELLALESRRTNWERRLQAQSPGSWNSAASVAMLGELRRMLDDRDERYLKLSSTVAAYLAARQRAYTILGWHAATDELHGPLDAATLTAMRAHILARLRELGQSTAAALEPLLALKHELETIDDELRRLRSVAPRSPRIAALNTARQDLARRWDEDALYLRAVLAARDGLRAQAQYILEATGGEAADVRAWDGLDAIVRWKVARLISSTPN